MGRPCVWLAGRSVTMRTRRFTGNPGTPAQAALPTRFGSVSTWARTKAMICGWCGMAWSCCNRISWKGFHSVMEHPHKGAGLETVLRSPGRRQPRTAFPAGASPLAYSGRSGDCTARASASWRRNPAKGLPARSPPGRRWCSW